MEVLSMDRKTTGKQNVIVSLEANDLSILTNAVYQYQKVKSEAADMFEGLRRLQYLLAFGKMVIPKPAKEEKE